jgi:hypothetical protein
MEREGERGGLTARGMDTLRSNAPQITGAWTNPGGAPRIPRQVAAAAASSGAIQKRAAAAATSTDRACHDAVVNR